MAVDKDYTNYAFGGYVVRGPVPDREGYWECVCKCGHLETRFHKELRRNVHGCKNCAASARRKYVKGRRYGNLTVLSEYLSDPVECECDCGVREFIPIGTLWNKQHGHGCSGCTNSKLSELRTLDLTDMTFGSLRVISRSENTNDLAHWICQCACGNVHPYSGSALHRGRHTTCPSCSHVNASKARKIFVGGGIPIGYWGRVIWGAKRRGKEFAITPEYAYNLLIGQDFTCAISGVHIDFSELGQKHKCSLDRIDSQKGYVEGNLQWVHKDINFMKGKLPNEKFINYCKMIANNRRFSIETTVDRSDIERVPDWYWRRINIGAEERSLPVSISIDDISELLIAQNFRCALSNTPVRVEAKHTTTASLDRINSSMGYTLNNVQWVHKDINYIKRDYSMSDLNNWCALISSYQLLSSD